jgi:alkylation response protein AidB-like acyl-CoA dehydrogenase
MSWLGPELSADQREIVQVIDGLMADLAGPDDPAVATVLPRRLAGLGLWTLGVPEDMGGGGADWATTALVIERLSRTAPEAGLACARAHAAALALAGPGHQGLLGQLHAGEAEVIVVEAAAPHAAFPAITEGAAASLRVAGQVSRIDAFHPESAHLLILTDTPLLVAPAAVTVGPPLRTTGLTGMKTVPVTVEGCLGQAVSDLGPAPAAAGAAGGIVRAQMLGGIAAVAAGVAGAAFDAASAYARSRHQFGAPIARLAAVREALEDQALRVAGLLRALLAGPPDSLGAIAIADAGCSVALEAADSALQVHGGYGYLREYSVERAVRDAVSLRAAAAIPRPSSTLQLE